PSLVFCFSFTLRRLLTSTLFPYTTLFRSDRAHRRVVDPVRVQVDLLEALEYLEEQPGLVELADRVVEVELLQHFAHVGAETGDVDRKSTRLNSSHVKISYAVFCLKKKKID